MNMSSWTNYYLRKWIREADKANEKKRAEKAQQKFRRACLISKYGYDYYLRDRLWERIKNQKKKESYHAWKQRLEIYGFTVQGFDTQRNEQHYGKPLVHEYVFGDNILIEDNQSEKEGSAMKQLTWDEIMKSFTQNPRDVITRENGIWYYVYSEKDNVYIESGKNHTNRSRITVRRRLDKENFEKVLAMYINNEPRIKVRDVTQNASYWFGIFSELLAKGEDVREKA